MPITQSNDKKRGSPPKLSLEVFDKRLPKHVVRIGPFKGLNFPIAMKCDLHGKYTAKTGYCATRKLGGCSSCQINNSKTAKKPKSHETYVKDVKRGSKNKIKVLGTYINSYTKIDHQCSCGRTWKVAPRSMLQNFGTCKHCVMSRETQTRGFKFHSKEIGGITFRVQGYEGEALQFLLNRGIDLKNVKVHDGRLSAPYFKYKHNEKVYKYFPDFFCTESNTVYEVKSTFTLGLKDKEVFYKNKKKAKSVIRKGFKFKLLLGGLDKLPVIVFPPNWIDMTHMQLFSWLEDCYGVKPNRSHGRTF